MIPLLKHLMLSIVPRKEEVIKDKKGPLQIKYKGVNNHA